MASAEVIDLRGGLVVQTPPGLPAVNGDYRALVAGQNDDVRVVRINPNVLIIVAARCAAKRRPGLASVGRLPGDNACRIDNVRVLSVDAEHCEIATTNASGRPRISSDLHPMIAAIVGAIDCQPADKRYRSKYSFS